MMANRKIALFAIPVMLAAASSIPAVSKPSVLVRHYAVVHGWPMLPKGRVLGACSAVAVNSRGEVLVFHRGKPAGPNSKPMTLIDEPVVEIFDGKTGKLLREWGAGMFVAPHGLSVDAKDHVWLTDTALNQVFEFSPDGKLLRTLGERGIAGADASHFDRPTDVAVLADGSFLVGDGYGNSRVVKFAVDGKFLFEWGKRGTGPGEFNNPHAIALDGTGKIYVADRYNDRVQVFDARGKYLSEWKSPEMGRPYGLAMLASGRIAIADGGTAPATGPDHDGVAIARLDGHVVDRFGRIGPYDGQFRVAHDIAADRQGNLYVVDVTGMRVQKFALR